MREQVIPTISVVVPVYNGEATIAACLESILSQRLSPREIIVIDDGSTDQTPCILDQFCQRQSRDGLVVLHQPNGGVSHARWQGACHATSEWLAFVDADDRLPANALELLATGIRPDTDIVMGNGQSLGADTPQTMEMQTFRHHAVRGDGTIGVPWGSLYRRCVITQELFDWPRDIVNGEDYLFWLRLVFSTGKAVSIVREAVYDKGQDHSSRLFKWTADYAHRLNRFRMKSIPEHMRAEYEADALSDRLANMFSVAICQTRRQWSGSAFYQEILQDCARLGQPLSPKRRLFFALPSRRLRRFYGWLSDHLRKKE